VWDRVTGGRYAAERSAAGTWSNPVLIGCGSAYACGTTLLGVDRAGNLTAVWDAHTGNRSDVQVLTKPAAGLWSTPLTVTGPRLREQGYEPRLDVAPNGAAVISFQARSGGEIVLRKSATGTWARPSRHRFADLDTSNGVAIGRDGRVVVVGDSERGGAHVVAHVFRPRTGWLPARDLGRAGGNTELAFLDMGPRGSATVAWTVNTKNYARSAVVVRQMSTRYRWGPTKVVSPWLGQSTPVFISDVAAGPRGTATVTWSGRLFKASTRRPSGAWVTRQPVPDRSTQMFSGYSANQRGDAAVPWYTATVVEGALDSEEVHISVRTYPSLTWQRSPALGTSSCGTGERGDPGCRPFTVSTRPDGSSLVAWFDLDNALVARLVR
jgi:hypothetical protein